MTAWFRAFVFTQVVEVPIYVQALGRYRWPSRLAIAFGASLITHPVVWWSVLHFEAAWGYAAATIGAELFAIAVEALWMSAWRVRWALLWSLAANLSSVAIGALSRWFLDFP